jgi:hypothetical protein
MRDKPMILWSDPDRWEKVSSKAVSEGSQAQMRNVLEMALQDIKALSDAIKSETTPWIVERQCDEPIRFPES